MKSKIISIILIGFACISLAACEGDDVESVLDQAAEQVAEKDQEETFETPEAVKNLTPEEDALLTGAIKDGVYTNEYFGYQFTPPEGWSMEDGNESDLGEDLVPISEVYEKGYPGVVVSSVADGDSMEYISIIISSLEDDEIGMNEQELTEKDKQDLMEIYEIADVERIPEVSTADLCGEEHPVMISTSTTDNDRTVMIDYNIPKGDFKMIITCFGENLSADDLSACFKKL